MQADVIDLDLARSGDQRSGAYFAAWSVATKSALALAVGIAFPVLALSGFDPGVGVVTDRGLLTLALLYSLLPVGLKLIAIALMWRFPLGASEHAEIQRAIADRAT